MGYDDNADNSGIGAFRVVNSWGTGWGDNGYGWISYDSFQRLVTYALTMRDFQPDPAAPPSVG